MKRKRGRQMLISWIENYIIYHLLVSTKFDLKVVNMAETLTLRGELKGHRGWVTSIAPPLDPTSDVLLSSSR